MKPGERESVAGAIGWSRVDFLMASDDGISAVHLSHASSQVADQFIQSFVLCFCWQIAIKVAYKANADRNIVQIVAVYVAAVNLTIPTVPNFDLTVSGRSAVPDNEVVSQSIRHFADMPMIIVENACVPLTSPAVMDDYVFPPVARDASFVDGLPNCRCQILPVNTRLAARRGHEVFLFLAPRFLNDNRLFVIMLTEKKPVMFFGLWCCCF